MADFMRKNDHKYLTADVKLGVALHQQIDQFTDQHDNVRQAVKLLHPTQRKYAPVTLDILFDYFLIKNWEKYTTEDLDVFVQRIYTMLESKRDHYPTKLKEMLPFMIKDDFLLSCKNEERLIKTFQHIRKRAKFEHSFYTAHEDLKTHYTVLDNHFNVFFPDLIAHVDSFCNCK